MTLIPAASSSLGMALVMSSSTPLVLLDKDLMVLAASGSFCRSFGIDPAIVVGKPLFALGDGEWDIPQLRSLLGATAKGMAAIEAYEIDFRRKGDPPKTLIIHAHVLDMPADQALLIVMAVADETLARHAAMEKDALVREKNVLLQELNHRVANSLQIIASVLMQRVRNVQSEETRTHLRDAHNRVMSIATLQRQLAATGSAKVFLGPYFTELCASIGASMILDPALLSLTVVVDDSATTADRSVTLGLIVTELVINALKHAFPQPDQRGAIVVSYHATDNGWLLSVADDGVGFPGDHDHAQPGLGTGIVNALAAQLVADVDVRGAMPGTIVTIEHSD